jgi:glycosyltransferase involved in cell wall biosynthesis
LCNRLGLSGDQQQLSGKQMNVRATPVVSIGMPVYNCGDTLLLAMRSILSQSFCDWELLIIDDGSSDDTVEVARSISDERIRVVHDGGHLGLAQRLNQAIALSRGVFFARMDGDDVAYPDRLTDQVDFLREHPEIDVVGGGILVFGREGSALGTRKNLLTHEEICRRPWAGFYLAHPTWLGKMEWFREHGYRTDALRCEDQDLLLRTYEKSRFAALPEILLGYREHELSLKKIFAGRRSYLRSVIRESLAKGRYWMAGVAIVEHTFKGFAEWLAISTGLNYLVLRHRALPVAEGIAQRWKDVCTGIRAGN